MPYEALLADFDAVGRSDGTNGRVELVKKRYDILLVGDCDIETVKFFFGSPRSNIIEAGEFEKRVTGTTDSFAAEHCLEPLLRP